MSKLVLLVGNVGSGKSLFAKKLARREGLVVVNNDAIQQMCAGGEYDMYDPGKKSVYDTITRAAILEGLKIGPGVVVDRTLMSAESRAKYIAMGKACGAEIVVADFGPGTEEGLQRRIKADRGVPAGVWRSVFDRKASEYEPPAMEAEGIDFRLAVPRRYHVYAFDFDGTIVTHSFPEIGRVYPRTVETMRSLDDDPSALLVVWTCRSGDHLAQMRAFLRAENIPFDAINENPVFDTGSRKIYADVYYDDKAVRV